MRLIDADALIEATKNFCDSYEVGWTDRKVIAWINGAPSVDAVPVVHGRWLKNPTGFTENVCSCCLGGSPTDDKFKPIKTNYCPNCGAKMDGGNNG